MQTDRLPAPREKKRPEGAEILFGPATVESEIIYCSPN